MTLQSRYTILRKIADGGTAEIFLAKQQGAHGFEKAVVLKRIFTAFYADPQFRDMLVDEAHIAMTLSHSNIVQVLDLGEVDGRYFLALELVDGWTLDRTLKRAQAAGVPFAPALALYVTAEICRALAYAHGKTSHGKSLGIVHRDISPHNVLMSAEGEVKLTDFGIAKAHNKKEQSLGNMIKGKISFMSPEQASGASIDARSDLFSLGTMLYAMITRRLPFDAATDYETLMLVKSGDYLPPETARPGLNPELYRVIRKAMSKSADERYQKAEEMLLDVEQVMRLAFRPVGQTELQRWLADLSAKDGVPPLTRDTAPEPAAPVAVVGARPARGAPPTPAAVVGGRPARGAVAAPTGEESGLVLDIKDAVEVSPGRPPPRPGGRLPPAARTEPTLQLPDDGDLALAPWYKRNARALLAGLALLVVFAVAGKALRGARRKTGAAAAVAVADSPAPVTAPAPPPAPEEKKPVEETPAPVAAPAPPAAAEPAPVAAAAPALAAEVPPSAAPTPKPPRGEDAPVDKADAPDEAPVPKSRKASPQVVSVTFKTDPEGARVATHNRVYGTTPQPAKLSPGNTYEFTFTKTGYAPASKKYVAPAKGPQTLRVTLKKLPPEPPPKKAAAAPPPPPPKKGWFGR